MGVDAYETSFVASIGPGVALRTAAQTLAKHHVGMLVVEQEGELIGVISDRDIALAVVAGKRCPDSTTVQDVMSRASATVDAGAPLRSAIEAMRVHGVRRVPVVDDRKRVQGVLAADDLVRLLAGELAGVAGVVAEQSRAIPRDDVRGAGLAGASRSAAEHYLKPVLCAARDASAEQVCGELKARAVGCAVVVDAAGFGVGIVTDRDLALRVVAAGLEPATTPVSAVMSAPLAGVESTALIEDVVETMRAHAVRRVPVLRDGRPVGIVTCDDLVVRLGQELQALGSAFAKGQRSEWIASRIEHVREEAGERLGELAAQLGQLGDQALARIGHEVEALRERLSRTRR